jgi:hypothetical protein
VTRLHLDMKALLFAIATFLSLTVAASSSSQTDLTGHWLYVDLGSGVLLQLRADNTFRVLRLEFVQVSGGKAALRDRETLCSGKWKVPSKGRLLLTFLKGHMAFPSGVKPTDNGYSYEVITKKRDGKENRVLRCEIFGEMPLQSVSSDTLVDLGLKPEDYR